MNLCKYKNIFGKPNEAIHNIRIFDIAIVDVVMTIIGAKIIQIISNILFGINISYLIYMVGLFILGIILHRLFCVRTTIDKLYKESVHAYALRDQNRIFCYAFNNPFGSYAGVNRNCLYFKGYFNFTKMFCQCERESRNFDSSLVFGGLEQPVLDQ